MKRLTTEQVDKLFKEKYLGDIDFLVQLADDIRAKNSDVGPSKKLLAALRRKQRTYYENTMGEVLARCDLDGVKTLIKAAKPSRRALTKALLAICKSPTILNFRESRIVMALIDSGADPKTVLRHTVVCYMPLLKRLVAMGVAPTAAVLENTLFNYKCAAKSRYRAAAFLAEAYPEVAASRSEKFVRKLLNLTYEHWNMPRGFSGANVAWVYKAAAQVPGGVLNEVYRHFITETPYVPQQGMKLKFPRDFNARDLTQHDSYIRLGLVFLKRFAADSNWDPYVSHDKRRKFVETLDGQVCATKLAIELESSM